MRNDGGHTPSAAAIPTVAALLLCVFGLYPLANRLTSGDAVQWYDHARTFWMVIGGVLLVVLFLLAVWKPAWVDGMWNGVTSRVLRIPPRLFLGGVALFAFVVAAAFSVLCFGRQPHNADEVAQLFHAKILLSGRLALPPDPNPEFFGMDNMIDRNRWYSQFPIGGPALLALGSALRAAWLVNPMFLALSILSVYGFARRAYGEPVARATALLFALSPFALFMAASFMNHVPVLWLTSVAMMQLAIWVDAEPSRDAHRAAMLIGVALGVAFTIRPLDALVVAGVIGVMQLMHLRGSAARARSLVVQTVAGLVPIAVLLFVNMRTNGAPMRLGYEVLYGSAHQLGFHQDPYGMLHTPARAITFASKYLLQLNVFLFEWPLPVVGVIAAGLMALRRPTRWDFFLIALLFVQVVAYAAYWHDGTFRGPRFLFTAMPAIIILTARAPFVVAAIARGAVRRTTLLVVPACVLFAWLAVGVSNSVAGRMRMYRRGSPVTRVDPEAMARMAGLHNALVFINEGVAARNLHYLWELGLSRGNAARLMASASGCAVRVSIDVEEALRPSRMRGRLDRLVQGAMTFDARVPRVEPSVCVEDVRRDKERSASFAPFFPSNTIDATGRIGGNVVYALDLGEHNEVLRARFGDRSWYRFGVSATPGDTVAALVPYASLPEPSR